MRSRLTGEISVLSYRSDHPNHAHQLVVSASKHYYASNDGILKYQKKPFEVPLQAVPNAKHRHMIVLSLRDHCSGVFYSRVAFGPKLPSVREFLARAWDIKPNFPFHGIPKLLSIPQTVKALEPSLPEAITGLGVSLVDVTSGFQGGVRDIRTIESRLLLSIEKPIDELDDWVAWVCESNAKKPARVPGLSKIQLWQKHVPPTVVPPANWGNEGTS